MAMPQFMIIFDWQCVELSMFIAFEGLSRRVRDLAVKMIWKLAYKAFLAIKPGGAKRKSPQKCLSMFMFVNYRNSTGLLSKQQYYAEDDNYRHDDAYGSQPERATTC